MSESLEVDTSSEVESDSIESEGSLESSGGENLQEQVEEAIESGASEQEVKKLIKEFTLKVNGKEVKKSIDLGDEEAIRNELQLSAAARKAMQEAAELKKAVSEALENMKNNPWEALAELGLDPDELAELRIQQKIEEMKKSPEQIEREKMQKELEEARSRLKQQEEYAKEQERLRLQNEAERSLNDEIDQALTAHKTLPDSPMVIKRVADAMLWAMDQGVKDVSAQDVLPIVEKELRDEISKLLDSLPDEVMDQYMGKKTVERMRKKRIESAKPSKINNIKTIPETSKVQQTEESPKRRLNLNDFMRSR